jgi:hypothetical protein
MLTKDSLLTWNVRDLCLKSGGYWDHCFLGCYGVKSGRRLQTFRRNKLLVSRVISGLLPPVGFSENLLATRLYNRANSFSYTLQTWRRRKQVRRKIRWTLSRIYAITFTKMMQNINKCYPFSWSRDSLVGMKFKLPAGGPIPDTSIMCR